MSMAPFGFHEVQMECVSGQAIELRQPDLGQAPEALEAVEVDGTLGELVPRMINPEVAIAEVDQTVVTGPAIGVDDGARVDPAPDDAELGSPGRSRTWPWCSKMPKTTVLPWVPRPRRPLTRRAKPSSISTTRGRWTSQASRMRSRRAR